MNDHPSRDPAMPSKRGTDWLQIPCLRSPLLYGTLALSAALYMATNLYSTHTARAEEPPIMVIKHQVQESGMGGYSSNDYGGETYVPHYYAANYVKVVAKVDSVTVNSITVNRGNCTIVPMITLPQELKYGQAFEVRLGCDPLEVQAETDQGPFTFTFDQQ